VLRKEDTDWVKKCMEYEVEGYWRPPGQEVDQKGRGKSLGCAKSLPSKQFEQGGCYGSW